MSTRSEMLEYVTKRSKEVSCRNERALAQKVTFGIYAGEGC